MGRGSRKAEIISLADRKLERLARAQSRSLNVLVAAPPEQAAPLVAALDCEVIVVHHYDQARSLLAQVFFDLVFVGDRIGGGPLPLLSESQRLQGPTPRVLLVDKLDEGRIIELGQRVSLSHVLAKPIPAPLLKHIIETAEAQLVSRRLRFELELKMREQDDLLGKLDREFVQMAERNTMHILRGVLGAMAYRAPDSRWHAYRVSLFADRIALELGWPGARRLELRRGALLHDIGQLGLSDALVLKPGPLSPEEWTLMRVHPLLGYQLLESMDFLGAAREVVLQHHERWDGSGYPSMLSGEAIGEEARVFAIADTLDAMTSSRPWRGAHPFDDAYEEIVSGKGKAFDPVIVEAFTHVGRESWRAAVIVSHGLESELAIPESLEEEWESSGFADCYRELLE